MSNERTQYPQSSKQQGAGPNSGDEKNSAAKKGYGEAPDAEDGNEERGDGAKKSIPDAGKNG